MSTDSLRSYIAPVIGPNGQALQAHIGPAKQNDMPANWSCAWPEIWEKSDFDCQAIVKLAFGDTLWGLIRYSLYPYPSETPSYLFVENLETHPCRRDDFEYGKLPDSVYQPDPWIDPVGKWLIWHACQSAIDYCQIQHNATLISLVAGDDSVDYYRDSIGMVYVGSAPSAPGEDGHGFVFETSKAKDFCLRQQRKYGSPTLL